MDDSGNCDVTVSGPADLAVVETTGPVLSCASSVTERPGEMSKVGFLVTYSRSDTRSSASSVLMWLANQVR